MRVLRNHSCALQKTDSKWGRGEGEIPQVRRLPQNNRVRDDGGQGQVRAVGMERWGHTQAHVEGGSQKLLLTGWVWVVGGDCGVWGEEGEGQGLHLLSWGERWWMQVLGNFAHGQPEMTLPVGSFAFVHAGVKVCARHRCES